MRTSLTAGLVKNVLLNLNRQENDVRIFETGKDLYPLVRTSSLKKRTNWLRPQPEGNSRNSGTGRNSISSI